MTFKKMLGGLILCIMTIMNYANAEYTTRPLKPQIYTMLPIPDDGDVSVKKTPTHNFIVPKEYSYTKTDEYSKNDLHCLSEIVYFEARSETDAGKQAVAEVVLNRTKDHRFPSTICGVRNQKYNGKCQFSFACNGMDKMAKNMTLWNASVSTAKLVLEKKTSSVSKGALFFQSAYSRPAWTRNMVKTAQIGGHSFYRP